MWGRAFARPTALADERVHSGRHRSSQGLRAGSPERIRTAVTGLRGRRPRPLDDGASYRLTADRSGGRTRTLNDRTRTCCVANYTTPEKGARRDVGAYQDPLARSPSAVLVAPTGFEPALPA